MRSQQSSRNLRAPLRFAAVALLTMATIVVATPARAEPTTTAADVAAEIVDVQIQADAVAEQWTSLDAAAAEIDDRITSTTEAIDAATATVGGMEATLATIAVNRYTGAEQPTVFALDSTLMTGVQTTALTGFALGTGEFDLDGYRLAQQDLSDRQGELAVLRQQNTDAQATLQQRHDELDGYLVHLEALHAELQDDEVRRAYEQQLAERRRREEVATTAAAQAAAPARGAGSAVAVASTPTTSTSVVTPSTDAPAAKVADAATAPTPTVGTPAAPSTPSTAVQSTPPAATAAPVVTAPATVAPTPPTTSTPAAPPTTAAPPTPAPTPAAVGGLVCPLAGPSAFGDTWGAARENGKRHEGVDMISRFGTPIVAVADGYAQFKTNRLGGNAIGLKATGGDYFYYAHLSSWEGVSRNVRAGEVIGYVGHTGTTSVDHLHWEIHPGGGAAINPYPTARRIC